MDSELLADVYLELITNRELNFSSTQKKQQNQSVSQNLKNVSRETFPVREWNLDPLEESAHTEFLSKIKNPIWSEV